MPKFIAFVATAALCACATSPSKQAISTTQSDQAVFVPFDPEMIRGSKVWQEYSASLAKQQ